MRKAFQEVRANNPQSSGIVTEIKSTLGELPGSQPARRRDFYSRNGAQEAIDPYDIPLFQPDNAPNYIPQREIPGEGAIPGSMLFEPFGNRTVTGDEIAYMTRRIYVDGYGISPDDPYLADRLNAIPRGPESRLRPLTRFQPDGGTIGGATKPLTANQWQLISARLTHSYFQAAQIRDRGPPDRRQLKLRLALHHQKSNYLT